MARPRRVGYGLKDAPGMVLQLFTTRRGLACVLAYFGLLMLALTVTALPGSVAFLIATPPLVFGFTWIASKPIHIDGDWYTTSFLKGTEPLPARWRKGILKREGKAISWCTKDGAPVRLDSSVIGSDSFRKPDTRDGHQIKRNVFLICECRSEKGVPLLLAVPTQARELLITNSERDPG